MIAAQQNFTLGGRTPTRIAEPENAAELAAMLAQAATARESIVPFGGGTLQHASNPPARYDIAVRIAALDVLHAYDPRDLTAGAGAGIRMATLSHALAEHNQILPFDAPLARDATLGGTLAGGWAGPRRAAYGRPRDLVIGATVALADGTLAASGGMVVKNVTGYDMAKLYIGSHGTLGVLARVNVKVVPSPAAQCFASSPFDDDVRERLIANVAALTVQPTAMLVCDAFTSAHEAEAQPARATIVALFEGSESTVARALRDYRSALGAAGVAETRLDEAAFAQSSFQALLDRYVATPDTSFTLLSRGLPSAAAQRGRSVREAMVRSLNEAANGARGWETIVDLRTGDVVARFICGGASAIDEAHSAAGAMRSALGVAHLIAASDALAGRVDAWGAIPSTIATMRALKARFDPHGALAPDGSLAASDVPDVLRRDVRRTLARVFRRPTRVRRLIALGPRGWFATARFVQTVIPRASRELASIRVRAQAIPASALREQALASIDEKAYHVQGGAILATFMHGDVAHRYIATVAAIETIYDYLDNLCDRLPGVSQQAYATLHAALLDALDDTRTPANYYADGPGGDDGGYLRSLVDAARAGLQQLPHYALIRPRLADVARFYTELQVLKHGPPGAREAACDAWYARNRDRFPGLTWWEFAAACGSSMPVFALIALAARERCEESDVDATMRAYFPGISALHILLDYYIDQAEDREHGELNFIACYASRAEALSGLRRLVTGTLGRVRTLADATRHRFVVQAMCVFYLTHPKIFEQRLDRDSATLLDALR